MLGHVWNEYYCCAKQQPPSSMQFVFTANSWCGLREHACSWRVDLLCSTALCSTGTGSTVILAIYITIPMVFGSWDWICKIYHENYRSTGTSITMISASFFFLRILRLDLEFYHENDPFRCEIIFFRFREHVRLYEWTGIYEHFVRVCSSTNRYCGAYLLYSKLARRTSTSTYLVCTNTSTHALLAGPLCCASAYHTVFRISSWFSWVLFHRFSWSDICCRIVHPDIGFLWLKCIPLFIVFTMRLGAFRSTSIKETRTNMRWLQRQAARGY